jgi:hypothetical protein
VWCVYAPQVSALLHRDLSKVVVDTAREQARAAVNATVNSVTPAVASAVAASLQQELASAAGACYVAAFQLTPNLYVLCNKHLIYSSHLWAVRHHTIVQVDSDQHQWRCHTCMNDLGVATVLPLLPSACAQVLEVACRRRWSSPCPAALLAPCMRRCAATLTPRSSPPLSARPG